MTGVEFLAAAHKLHPAAKRMLLVSRDYTTRESDHARDDARPDRLSPRQAVAPRPRAVSGGERVSRELGGLRRREGFALFRIAALENSAARPRDPRPPDALQHAVHVPPDGFRGRRRAPARGRAGRLPRCRPSFGTTGACSSTRRTATSSRRSAAGRASVWTSTTSRSSVPGRPASRRRLCRLGRPRDDRPRAERSPAARRARARGSATSPASPGGSAATTSPIARASRRGCSGRTWSSRRR